MANELTIQCSVSFAKNGVTVPFGIAAKLRDVAGDRYIQTLQVIGTAEEALQKGELGTLGYCIAINRDANNFVTIRAATGLATGIKLNPGDACMFRCGGNAPFAIADTAPVNLEFMLVEA